MSLKRQQLPIYVDRHLSQEELAQRRRLMPLYKQLKRDGVWVRWVGARLEQQVTRAHGRKQWQEVSPLPPPEEAGAGIGGAQ